MELAKRAAEIMADAERKLAELVAEALRQRDYASVQSLTAIAQRLAGAQKMSPLGSELTAQPQSSVDDLRPPAEVAGDWVPETKGYPRFHRDESQLVKIGYSKSERRTYEHRSPKEALDKLVTLLVRKGKAGAMFTTESLLPTAEPGMTGIPIYQVYLCLGFLVRRGLVRRHGRAGYSIDGIEARDLPAAVRAAWETLPERPVRQIA